MTCISGIAVRDWSETPQIKQYLSKGITKLFPSLGDHFDDPGDAPGHDVLAQVLTEFGPANTLLITGAPLSNIKALLDYHPEIHIARLVCQGGFAGDNVVPPEKRLSKFAGLNAMASWNMGGDIAAAQQVLSSPLVASRIFVSKNVCHGVTYTEKLHSALGQAASKHPAYDLLFKTMCSCTCFVLLEFTQFIMLTVSMQTKLSIQIRPCMIRWPSAWL